MDSLECGCVWGKSWGQTKTKNGQGAQGQDRYLVLPVSGRWAGSHSAALHACSTWGSTESSVGAWGLLGGQPGSMAVCAHRNAPEGQTWLREEGLALLSSAVRGP